MGDGVQLRVLEWVPMGSDVRDPLVFVAGWVSVVEGWAPLLRVLAEKRPLLYIETREKRSALFSKPRPSREQFTIPQLADDLVAVVARFGIDQDTIVFFGSSMGANAILEALKHGRLRARGAFLIGPNSEFRFGWWGRLLIRMPASSYHLLKHFVLWYLRHFRIDARREPEQLRRYERSLNAAHPQRIKLSAMAVVDYQVWSGLETIDTPVAIAHASSDILHDAEEVQRIVARIPRARTVECPSNHYMHSAEVAADLEDFLASLSAGCAPRG